VDGVIYEDRLGLDRIYVQAKRKTDDSVGRPEIQAFYGALEGKGASKGDSLPHLVSRRMPRSGRTDSWREASSCSTGNASRSS